MQYAVTFPHYSQVYLGQHSLTCLSKCKLDHMTLLVTFIFTSLAQCSV